jgi:APA family basic amino acid/polyamine antiporter
MSQSRATATAAEATFVQGLGLLDSTMIVAGSMIGSGIFIVSADIAREVGSAGWLLALWVFTGALTLAAALSYGELAAMMPRAGGQYVYLREAYSPLWGFLYGWTLFLVIQTGTIAAVAMAFAKFLGVLIPPIAETNKFFTLGRFSLSPATLVAVAMLTLLTWSNSTGLRTGKVIQNIFTFAKIAALLGLIGLGIFVGANAAALQANFTGWWHATLSRPVAGEPGKWFTAPHTGMTLLLAAGTAMVGSLFSSDAWNNITFTAGEVKHPRRNLPLSLCLGVALVTALYLLSNVAYLVTLPLYGAPTGATVVDRGIQFAARDRVATAVMEVIFGQSGATIMAALILVSTFGCMNGMILAGARVYYAMAQDGLFFRRVGALNRRGVPQSGLVVQCVWACLLTLSGTYGDLLDYVIFAALLFYVVTVGGLFVLRRRRPDAERPYRAFGYPLVPALYCVCATLIAVDLLISPKTQGNTWPGLLIVLAGVPVYFLWRNRGAERAAGDAANRQQL